MAPPHIDPTLVTDCSGNLSRIIWTVDELTKEHILCCLATVSHLTVEDRSLNILEDISERYAGDIFTALRSHYFPYISTLQVILCVLDAIDPRVPKSIGSRWDSYKPTVMQPHNRCQVAILPGLVTSFHCN